MARSKTTLKSFAKKRKPANKKEPLIGKDGATLAVLNTILKSLGAIKSTVEERVKATMAVIFSEAAFKAKGAPASFKVDVDGIKVGCEIRRRGSNRAIPEEDVPRFKKNNIPMKETMIGYRPETYSISQEVLDDPKKVAKLISRLKGLDLGCDILEHDPGEPGTKAYFMLPESIAAFGRNARTRATTRQLMDVGTTLAIRTNADHLSMTECVDRLRQAGIELV